MTTDSQCQRIPSLSEVIEKYPLSNGQVVVGFMVNKRMMLQVKCSCGHVSWRTASNAVRSQSCGCMTKEILRKCRTVHGHSKGDGGRGTPTWKTWKSMLERCEWGGHKSFKDYGGRGIKVCDRWHEFAAFYADMGDRPEGKQMGRIDNERGYEPGNCRWETPKENANNRRSSVFLEHDGKRMTVTQWAEHLRVPKTALEKRISDGWSHERALTAPLRPDHRRAA